MGKVNRGRYTISTNIVMTTSLITRAFTFGFIMMSIYIKAGGDILEGNVINVVNGYDINGIPYGSAVKGLVFSLAGVFGMDLITGISGLYGLLKRKKTMLGVNVVLSALMLSIYCIYIVLFGIIYGKRHSLSSRLQTYNTMYRNTLLSSTYQYGIYPSYVSSLGCTTSVDNACSSVYNDQLKGYIEAYFGMIAACMVCQVVSIIAVEYTFRKLELKEKKEKISSSKFYLLCTIKHGIFRSFLIFVKKSWKRSKLIFASVVIKIASLITGIGLLGLGLTIISHEFIINSRLKSLFFKLQFFEYYLYDIIVGLAASCVTIGIATIIVAIIGLVGSLRRSKQLQLANTVLSFLLQIPRIACFILFVAFLGKMNYNLRSELEIQQHGYYASASINDLTVEWNTMIQKLDCCGVNNYTETLTTAQKSIFCYENAQEIPTYPTESYTNNNNLAYIGTGDFRTTTCKSRIHFILRMMIGWFGAIIMLQVILEIVGTFFANKEFKIYQEEDNLHETKTPLDSDTGTSHNIVLYILIKVKAFVHRSWKRSKVNFVFWLCVSCFALLNFGLLVLAIQIRYDKVLGNIYIKEYVFNYIDIGDYSLKRLIDYFHIVLSTFSIASIIVAVYIFVMEALSFSKRTLHLILIIVFLSTLFAADITQIGLWGKAYREIDGNLTSGLALHITNYRYSHNSLTNYHHISAGWNTLFIKAECCGVSPQLIASMATTGWYVHSGSPNGKNIPEYCCKSISILYPYSTLTNTDCTQSLLTDTYHTQGCDDAIQDKIRTYSITAFVFLAISVILELVCVLIAIYEMRRLQKEGDTVHVHVKAVEDKVEIIKLEETNEENIQEKESKRKDGKKHKERKKRKQSGKKVSSDDQITNPETREVEIEDFDEKSVDVQHGVEKKSEVHQSLSQVNENIDSVVNVATYDDERPQTRQDSISERDTQDIPNSNVSADDFYSQTVDADEQVSTTDNTRDFNEMVTDLDVPEITDH